MSKFHVEVMLLVMFVDVRETMKFGYREVNANGFAKLREGERVIRG